MRKVICAAVIFTMLFGSSAYSLDTTLFEIRNKIFDESRSIKLLLPNARRDLIFMNSMWDSCIVALGQMDAYFSMIGIFNTIKKDAATENAVDYIYGWLDMMKTTNVLNIKNLNAIASRATEANTKLHAKKLTDYYTELNAKLAVEIVKVNALKLSVKKDKTPAGGK